MNASLFKSGYVEKIFTYGKCGLIRGMDGRLYFYNPNSFDSERKRLKVGEAVVFRAERSYAIDGKNPLVTDLKTVEEVMKLCINCPKES